MPLYTYKVTIAGGVQKAGKVTSKTADSARKTVVEKFPGGQISELKEQIVKAVAPIVKGETADDVMKLISKENLEKLMYLQSGKCFFCGDSLSRAEASVDHLYPKSKGGGDFGDNLVVCCKKLNQFFGDMSVKEKIRFILSQKGSFVCPRKIAGANLTPQGTPGKVPSPTAEPEARRP